MFRGAGKIRVPKDVAGAVDEAAANLEVTVLVDDAVAVLVDAIAGFRVSARHLGVGVVAVARGGDVAARRVAEQGARDAGVAAPVAVGDIRRDAVGTGGTRYPRWLMSHCRHWVNPSLRESSLDG